MMLVGCVVAFSYATAGVFMNQIDEIAHLIQPSVAPVFLLRVSALC